MLSKHPLLTNCVTYGLLYSGSEFLQQTIIRHIAEPGHANDYDLGSIARYVGILERIFFPISFTM